MHFHISLISHFLSPKPVAFSRKPGQAGSRTNNDARECLLCVCMLCLSTEHAWRCVSFAAKHAKTCMSLAVKHNGVFVTWLITKYDWSRKACLRTSSVMPPLPSLYYEYSPILLPPNRGASLLFIRSRRSRLESPRSMRNSALSTYSSVLSSKAQTSGFSCLNNSTICLSRLWVRLCGLIFGPRMWQR